VSGTAGFQYVQLADKLRERILAGEYTTGAKLASIREIARHEGLNTLTVSRAIDVLAEQGYVVKSSRRGIFVQRVTPQKEKAHLVGVLTQVLPNVMAASPELKTMFHNLQKQIMRAGHRILMQCGFWYPYPHKPNVQEYIPPEEVRRLGLDALLTVGIYNHDYIASLARLRLPTLTVDIDAMCLGVDSVAFDNRAGAFALTQELLNRGHKHICYVGGPLPPRVPRYYDAFDPSALERAEGYCLALQALAPGQEARMFHNEEERSPGAFLETAKEALASHPECTAILCEGAMCLAPLARAGLEIAGFEVEEFAPFTGLAGVAHCDYGQLGNAAADLILKRFADPDGPVRRTLVKPEIRMLAGARNG